MILIQIYSEGKAVTAERKKKQTNRNMSKVEGQSAEGRNNCSILFYMIQLDFVPIP